MAPSEFETSAEIGTLIADTSALGADLDAGEPRARLGRMSDRELLEFGRAAAELDSRERL